MSERISDDQISADGSTSSLPPHVETSVETVATLRAEHRRAASRYQRTIDRLTARIGSPGFTIAVTAFIGSWIAINLALPAFNLTPFDRPPFFWLQGTVSASALYVTVLILTTQRHENILAEHRAQLTLQIALISERKMAKLIERTEEHRRDDPAVESREDPEASAMSSPVDPRAMSVAIRASQEQKESDAQ